MATDRVLFDELYRGFCAFQLILEAATVPTPDGGRRVSGHEEARILSEHAERLCDQLVHANRRIAAKTIGNDAAMIGELLRAESTLASPVNRSEGDVADGSAEEFQRYRQDDILGPGELGTLKSVHELLAKYEQRTRTAWADASPAELDGTCVDLSCERRSVCNAVKSMVTASTGAVIAQVQAFAALCPEDRHTAPTFDSDAARAVAVFRLLEVADAGGVDFSNLLPPGLVFSKPDWEPGDDPADAPAFLEKCARWLQRMESAVSDHRMATAERVAARHAPTTNQSATAVSYFHLSTDLRATSDPLWQRLSQFRRWLMEGGTYTPADWQNLLIDIRWKAHSAGLRPELGSVEYIAATLSEVREGAPSRAWEDEPDNWSKVILTASGEGGWIELHDLLDRFDDKGIPANAHKRSCAIEWAEGWMNARERQLCQPAAVDPGAIDRAAERAAAKAFEAMESRGNTGIGGTDTDWRDVQGRLLVKRERGEPYTSLRKLCAELKCSDATIRKAIGESEALKGWQTRSRGPKTAPKATGLAAVVRDNTRQRTEPDPAEFLPEDERDAALSQLMEEHPESRAEVNAMSEEGKTKAAKLWMEQRADREPSPLQPDDPDKLPRRVRQHRRA